MVKRIADHTLERSLASKRPRLQNDHLSALSDEVLLRIFTNLSIEELNLCQTVSHRFRRLATDSQLWKSAYYDRFVRPRIARLSRRKSQSAVYSQDGGLSRLARWLDEDYLVKRGSCTDWKKQYKIRHNWSRGSCDVNEIPIPSLLPTPPILARLHGGIVYTVDEQAGLRAWSHKDERKLLATLHLRDVEGTPRGACPVSIAVDMEGDQVEQDIVIGYEDGAFSVFGYLKSPAQFSHRYSHPASSSGPLTAVALQAGYLLCMTKSQILSLYQLPTAAVPAQQAYSEPPRLLTSLRSQTVWPPLSLSIRKRSPGVLASIAYCLPTYSSGWSTGVQELLISADGDVLESRLASAAGQGFSSLSSDPRPTSSQNSPRRSSHTPSSPQVQSRPTSLSYSHPYLLVSHSDNTMTIYMVTSTKQHLSVAPGRRLWGHTSSIFGAHVGGRGKAVSVSARGDEIRVWELEGGLANQRSSDEEVSNEFSVQITPEKSHLSASGAADELLGSKPGLQHALSLLPGDKADELAVTRGWVGFDEENVIVLREQQDGMQALTVFGFS